jgi:hypothetical protein
MITTTTAPPQVLWRFVHVPVCINNLYNIEYLYSLEWSNVPTTRCHCCVYICFYCVYLKTIRTKTFDVECISSFEIDLGINKIFNIDDGKFKADWSYPWENILYLYLLTKVVNTYRYMYKPSKDLRGGRRGRDHMVVGFTTTCAISAYHH